MHITTAEAARPFVTRRGFLEVHPALAFAARTWSLQYCTARRLALHVRTRGAGRRHALSLVRSTVPCCTLIDNARARLGGRLYQLQLCILVLLALALALLARRWCEKLVRAVLYAAARWRAPKHTPVVAKKRDR